MRKLTVVSLFIFWAIFTIKAQNQPTGNTNNFKYQEQETVKTGSNQAQSDADEIWGKHLIINSDSRVDTLLQIHREENLRKGGTDGYRVQIFQGTKDAAYQAKAKFISSHENIKVYVLFQSPDFKVRVGDFRTKSEAIKLKYFIKNEFPAVYIIDDVINYPELGEDKTDI
jgi:hypothetical protein